MYTAKRSNENEFRSQHCLYPAKRTAIARLHNVKGSYILKPIKLPSGQLLGLAEPSGDCEKGYSSFMIYMESKSV